MNAAVPDPTTPPETGSILDWFRAWNRFWFAPAEPTMLGMMRILCGLLLLYVHLSYTVGLLSYVGPDGWGDRKVTDWMRKEVIFQHQPMDWNGPPGDPEKGYVAWSVWFHVDDPF